MNKIDLNDLKPSQKSKLLKFYNVDGVDKLHVNENGMIGVVGSGKDDIELMLSQVDNSTIDINIDTFINNQKNLGFQKGIKKEKAKTELNNFLKELLGLLTENNMETICIEFGSNPSLGMLLFQQCMMYFSNKLASILCRSVINSGYISSTAKPDYSPVNFYNLIKDDSKIIIKGFAFCSIKSKELFINTICGTGGTAKIVENILFSIENNQLNHKVKYVALESVDTSNAVSFYSKLGFRKTKKDSLIVIDDMIDSKSKSFDDYCKERGTQAGGILYLFPHNKDGETYMNKKKANWLYNPEKWFEQIKQLKSENKSRKYIVDNLVDGMKTTKLEGGGVGDYFNQMVDNKFKEQIAKKKQEEFYANRAKKHEEQARLEQERKAKMKQDEIDRVQSEIKNRTDQGNNDYNNSIFRDFRNQYINGWLEQATQHADVDLNKPEVMDRYRSDLKYYLDRLKKEAPNYSDIYNTMINDATENVNRVAEYYQKSGYKADSLYGLKQAVKTITPIASLVSSFVPVIGNKLSQGFDMANQLAGQGKPMELHAVIFPKDKFTLEQAKDKAKEFIKDKNKNFYRETKQSYRFRNIPKTKFAKRSYRTKVLDDGVSLVFGIKK